MIFQLRKSVKFSYQARPLLLLLLLVSVFALGEYGFMWVLGLSTEDIHVWQLFWICLAILLYLAMTAWYVIRRGGNLVIDGQGLRYTGLLGNETSLAWGAVHLRRGAMGVGLQLSDAQGQAKIEIDPQLEGFTTAVELVRQARPDLWRVNGRDFQKRTSLPPFLLLLLLEFFVLLWVVLISIPSILNLSADNPQNAIWIVILMAGLVIGMSMATSLALHVPLKLYLQGHELVVRFITSEKRLCVEQLADVTMDFRYFFKIGVLHNVNIYPLQGSQFKLATYYRNGAEIYCLLRTWLEDQRKVRSTGG